jgi:hypothetical protein
MLLDSTNSVLALVAYGPGAVPIAVPFQQRRIYLSAYTHFAVITVQTRHQSGGRPNPTRYISGKWTDDTPLTDEENAEAKRRFIEIEQLQGKPIAGQRPPSWLD